MPVPCDLKGVRKYNSEQTAAYKAAYFRWVRGNQIQPDKIVNVGPNTFDLYYLTKRHVSRFWKVRTTVNGLVLGGTAVDGGHSPDYSSDPWNPYPGQTYLIRYSRTGFGVYSNQVERVDDPNTEDTCYNLTCGNLTPPPGSPVTLGPYLVEPGNVFNFLTIPSSGAIAVGRCSGGQFGADAQGTVVRFLLWEDDTLTTPLDPNFVVYNYQSYASANACPGVAGFTFSFVAFGLEYSFDNGQTWETGPNPPGADGPDNNLACTFDCNCPDVERMHPAFARQPERNWECSDVGLRTRCLHVYSAANWAGCPFENPGVRNARQKSQLQADKMSGLREKQRLQRRRERQATDEYWEQRRRYWQDRNARNRIRDQYYGPAKSKASAHEREFRKRIRDDQGYEPLTRRLEDQLIKEQGLAPRGGYQFPKTGRSRNALERMTPKQRKIRELREQSSLDILNHELNRGFLF